MFECDKQANKQTNVKEVAKFFIVRVSKTTLLSQLFLIRTIMCHNNTVEFVFMAALIACFELIDF